MEAAVAAAATGAAGQLSFNVLMATTGDAHRLSVTPSDTAAELKSALTKALPSGAIPAHCGLQLFQSGRVLIDSDKVEGLNASEDVFAIISRSTEAEVLLRAAGSYPGYRDLLHQAGQAFAAAGGGAAAANVGPLPTILHVLEELGGQPPELKDLVPGPDGGQRLEFRGCPRDFDNDKEAVQGRLLVPSLDAQPLLEAAGRQAFSRVTLCAEINSDAYNRGLGIALEASPLLELTKDEKGIPPYVYSKNCLIESTQNNNTVKFHPGMPGGQLRVEGGGGFYNESIGFTPESWTDSGHRFHKLEVTAGADGDNEVRITGTDGEVWSRPFKHKLTDGVQVPAAHVWLDLADCEPVHIGNISLHFQLG